MDPVFITSNKSSSGAYIYRYRLFKGGDVTVCLWHMRSGGILPQEISEIQLSSFLDQKMLT